MEEKEGNETMYSITKWMPFMLEASDVFAHSRKSIQVPHRRSSQVLRTEPNAIVQVKTQFSLEIELVCDQVLRDSKPER